jgi:uncharacterized Rmd1/YagE family protein
MELEIQAYYFGLKIQIQQVEQVFNENPEKSDSTYLLYQIGKDEFVYFKDFGCAVFVNVPKDKQLMLINKLNKTIGKGIHHETYKLCIIPEEDISVGFDHIVIPEMDIELIHIIVLNLAQSSILEHYQSITDDLLEETRGLSSHLELTGQVKLTRKRLAKFIGRTMSLRNKIADNLYIFESPPLAWTDIRLSRLDGLLSEELDFKNRYQGIQSSLSVIRENHEFYKDMLQHKHSSMLEWIIIILILFEIVQIFID